MRWSRNIRDRAFACLALISSLSSATPAVAQSNQLNQSESVVADAAETHWAFKPITRPPVPAIAPRKWQVRNPIDQFIYARLAAEGLAPSPEAPRRALIRRLCFDLTGLPPTPAEVTAFERERAPDAYERLVDRLLASPRYGERWAQHWLDVVRFAESHGFEMNQPRASAWRYRDYVIDSFNQDKPYDRFVLEQFAGDLLGIDAATGFLVAGAWDQVKSPDPVLTASQRADELHDMVSTTGSAFLGLTVGCARCHNHKFDPVPQAEYYAIKACLAGVQHGERKLRTPELAQREAETEQARQELATLENALTTFEPLAHTGQRLTFEPEIVFGSRGVQLLKPAKRINYAPGKGRGERDDPGDTEHLPNQSRNYLAWSNAANADVYACEPGLDGTFRVWLSWGCGSPAFAGEAIFYLDRDGDPTTTDDRCELARVDERRFADGTGELNATNRLWSGFHDGGVWNLASSNRVILRAGSAGGVVTAGVLVFIEEPAGFVADADATGAEPSGSNVRSDTGETDPPNAGTGTSTTGRVTASFLRAPVNARRNVERFAPVSARRLRFTVSRTTGPEPCLDELEVFTAGPNPTNIALSAAGTKASASSVFPNSDIHRLEHINDGKFGNSHSWISNERGKGWVELEFPATARIDRVIWQRDREQQFSDRLATEYKIEVSTGSNDWRTVASSQDRVAYVEGRTVSAGFALREPPGNPGTELKRLLAEQTRLEEKIKQLADVPMVYAGTLVAKPEPTYRLQRGDPMLKREEIAPGGLSVIRARFDPDQSMGKVAGALAAEPTDDQRRRLALAEWMVDPRNPLPARVIVNRVWQHHFGEGLVSTPSDFGRKGSPPSHPQLLDWLASELVSPTIQSGSAGVAPWSLKHIHRLIVTSATYRQGGAARRTAVSLDAGSRLLWRFPPQRLDAESLRDTILMVSGKLELGEGGPGFNVFEPNDNYVRVYNPKKEFGPAEWRRMIYMTKIRMQQDATFGAFDCPDGGQITPKRIRSTTPLQALNLLNSEFMMQQSILLGERLEREAGRDPAAQVRLAFELAYSRRPDSAELKRAKTLIQLHGLPIFCRALFNSNEFIFVE